MVRRLVVLPQGDAANQDFFLSFFVVSVTACVLSWTAASRGLPAERRPWRWIAAAFTALVIPQPFAIVYAAQHGLLSDNVVLTVLLGRLLWAPLTLIGILSLPMAKLTGRQRTRFVADLATVMGGGFVITWYFQLSPALADGPLGVNALTVLGFPTTDLVLIFGVCALLMRNGLDSLRGPLPLLLAGLLAYLIADIVYANTILHGAVTWSTPVATMLNTATLAIAAAATLSAGPRTPALPAVQENRRGVAYLPYAALISGYAMLLLATVGKGMLYPWGGLVAGVIVMTGAVVMRQVVVMRENHGLIVRDHLTGLANRIAVGTALGTAVHRHQHGGDASAVLLIDLDGFKQINDTHGHEAGDTLLIAFAAVLRRTIRGSDVAARVGGDEFLVMLDRPGTAEQAQIVARRILDTAAEPILIDGIPTPIRASIGIAMTDPDPDAGVTVIRHRADMAMYAAKRDGRHGIEFWTPTLHHESADRDAFDTELAAATGAGQLRVLYQPIVALATGEITAVEALVRWEHPTRGTIYPDAFIPAAESSGAIEQIGLWVLREATAQVRRWQRNTARSLYVSVNLSPQQLSQPNLVQQVTTVLDEVGLDPHSLVLELTENALVHDQNSVAVLETLRASGVRIAVDDFGTGYSSLSYLTRLPVDILKLDRSFVNELNGDPKGSAVAEAVIRLAQALDLDTVAEGIEIPAQATELTLLGYHHGQGYHYARPVTADTITELLHTAHLGETTTAQPANATHSNPT